jgi:hypothetical protein
LALHVVSPRPIDPSTGLCPHQSAAGLSETAGSADPVNWIRLTVLDPGGPGHAPHFICDRNISLAFGNQVEVLVPQQPRGVNVDVIVEGFAQATAGAPILLKYSGEARGLPAGAGAITAEVLAVHAGQFGCLSEHPVARAFHSATLLPDGQVLLAGGLIGGPDPLRFAATETLDFYDPHTHRFYPADDQRVVKQPRAFHQAFLVAGGPPYRLLLMGGVAPPAGATPGTPAAVLRTGKPEEPFRVSPLPGSIAAPVELLIADPVTHTVASSASSVAGLPARMFGATSEDPDPLAAGLVLGGASTFTAPGFIANRQVQQLDRATGLPLPTSTALGEDRIGGTVTPLGPNAALIFGGDLAVDDTMKSARAVEILRGVDGAITSSIPTPTPGPVATAFHAATSIDSSQVLVTGGFALSGGVAIDTPSALLQMVRIDGAGNVSAQVLDAGGALPVGYAQATALEVPAEVLISGGSPSFLDSQLPDQCGTLTRGCATRQAVLVDPMAQTGHVSAPLQVARYGHRQTRLPDGMVLVTGGFRMLPDRSTQVVESAELFNPFDAGTDRATRPPFSIMRPIGDEANRTDPRQPRCPTRSEIAQ